MKDKLKGHGKKFDVLLSDWILIMPLHELAKWHDILVNYNGKRQTPGVEIHLQRFLIGICRVQ